MEVKNNQTFIITDDTTAIIELHKNEMQLIRAIRNKFRFGEITIIVRDGLPVQLKRTIEFENLDKNS
jgi:hypothetical protein